MLRMSNLGLLLSLEMTTYIHNLVYWQPLYMLASGPG